MSLEPRSVPAKAWKLICGGEPGSGSTGERGSGGGLVSNWSRVGGSTSGLAIMRWRRGWQRWPTTHFSSQW